MDPKQRKQVITLSILLHILLLLFWEGAAILNFLGITQPAEPVVPEQPIVFDLQQERPKQVIETPDDAKVVEKQKKADFLSDKNALARNRETDPNLKIDDAYSKGIIDSRDLPVPQKPIGKPQPPPQLQQEPQQKQEENQKKTEEQAKPDPGNLLLENSGAAFYREYVLKRPNPLNPGVTEQLPGVTHDNQKSRVEDMGGLSFNTYDWNFAPYLLMLKKRIQRNIFPPAAFTQLGLISGETLVRFRIYPSGKMTKLEVLSYQGDKRLMQTSYNAVDISAPFPKLPPDFPEQFLEITGKFMYLIHRGPQRAGK